MGKLLCIGEALIDLVETKQKDKLTYTPHVGGAPTNVAIIAKHLGAKSWLISQVGDDHFGDIIASKLKDVGVNQNAFLKTKSAQTPLAFVHLDAASDRSFSFYRTDTADLKLTKEALKADWFEAGDILHFCSVSLVNESLRAAHQKAIKLTKEKGGLISFDVNIRKNLWKDEDALKKYVFDFIKASDIVKVSEEELSFLSDEKKETEAIKAIFKDGVKMVLVSKGEMGASLYNKSFTIYQKARDMIQ